MMAPNTIIAVFFNMDADITLVEMFNTLLRSKRLNKTQPIADNARVTIKLENKPDEMIFLASGRSFAAKALTNRFRIPFPMPKSNVVNQFKMDKRVYHIPRMTLSSSKKRRNKGVLMKEITIAAPLIKKVAETFFTMIFSFSFNFFIEITFFLLTQQFVECAGRIGIQLISNAFIRDGGFSVMEDKFPQACSLLGIV